MNPQQPKPNQNLSQISHLFLSGLREQSGNGVPRPQRKAPLKQDTPEVELSAEEMNGVFGDHPAQTPNLPEQSPKPLQISAVLGIHLNGSQFERVREYARHLAATQGRIGLIQVDQSEFRLACYEANANVDSAESTRPDAFDPQRTAEALAEMHCDVDRWIVSIPNPHSAEAHALLGKIEKWTVLATCDPDGVISCYRTIKGLADASCRNLSVALIGSDDESQAQNVYRKLAGVSQQFLNLPLGQEPAVRPVLNVIETVVLEGKMDRDESSGHQPWSVVNDFLAAHPVAIQGSGVRGQGSVEENPKPEIRIPNQIRNPKSEIHEEGTEDIENPNIEYRNPKQIQNPKSEIPSPRPSPGVPGEGERGTQHSALSTEEVLDLPDGVSILSAVLNHSAGQLIDSTLRPPTCPQAILAVSRERKLVLLALAQQGLSDLRSIGMAYRWLAENRSLIAMAIPQFAIDVHALPQLRLLVDHADLSADLMQPLLQAGHVTVQSYRKLKWGQKTGLLLEAA